MYKFFLIDQKNHSNFESKITKSPQYLFIIKFYETTANEAFATLNKNKKVAHLLLSV